jgi:hypothetical protein
MSTNLTGKNQITVQPTRRQLLERVRTIGRASRKAGRDPIAELIREREEDDRLERRALK